MLVPEKKRAKSSTIFFVAISYTEFCEHKKDWKLIYFNALSTIRPKKCICAKIHFGIFIFLSEKKKILAKFERS